MRLRVRAITAALLMSVACGKASPSTPSLALVSSHPLAILSFGDGWKGETTCDIDNHKGTLLVNFGVPPAQPEGSIVATLSWTDSSPVRTFHGATSGTIDAINITASDKAGCTYTARASLDNDRPILTGTYVGLGTCAPDRGHFTLVKQ